MNLRRVISSAFLAWLLASPSASAQVQLQIEGGRVTMIAKQATIAEILAEWSRIGGTAFLNGDKVASDRLDLELSDMPERAALDLLLRSASGYLITARPQPNGSRSQYLRVLVMPTSTAPPMTATTAPLTRSVSLPGAPAQRPQNPAQRPQEASNADDQASGGAAAASDAESAAANAGDTVPPRRFPRDVPIGNPLSQPGLIPERFLAFPQAPAPSGAVTAPGGSATPGAIVGPVVARPPAGQTFSRRPVPTPIAPAAPTAPEN